MARVEFRPSGLSVTVEPGTELVDAARSAGITIHTPCGGKGTCGRCMVMVMSGTVEDNSIHLSETERERGVIQACRARITRSDCVIEIPEFDNLEEDIYDNFSDVTQFIKNILTTHPLAPLCRKQNITIPEPQPDDGLGDLDRLKRALENENDEKNILIPLTIIRSLPDVLRKSSWQVSVLVSDEEAGIHTVKVSPSGDGTVNFGLAIDLGTTTVSVIIADLESGNILSSRSGYNSQIACGLDIISRINYASTPGRLADLQKRILVTINRMIRDMSGDLDLAADDITTAVISGNTVMTNIVLGIIPEHIRLEPYAPGILSLPPQSAADIGLAVHAEARVRFSPSVGSYVGGDITAGILCTDIAYGTDEINLFIDIGTNGEIVMGNKDFLMTCACSAGPAFEGGGIGCGMRATRGAIDHVTVNRETGAPSIQVMGDVEARGICGSGMIDLLSELLISGWMDQSGKLQRDSGSPHIISDSRSAAYVLSAGDADGRGMLTVRELDIENILRAKAAIYSACALMLEHAGLTFTEISHFYVAGGFGRYLNIENAVAIGLLPDISRDRFHYLGNASMKGSLLTLLSGHYRDLQKELAAGMTYINLSSDPGYMDQYTAALFFPHTDMAQFPGIKEKIKR